MKRRLLQTLITCVVMSSLIVVPVCASPTEDKETLEAKKSEAEAQAASVNEELVSLLVDFNALKQDMATQEDRIAQAETDLAKAKEEEEKQYEDMKLRIKYMYENGDATFAEALLTAKSYTDLVSKSEYVEKVHGYDRNKLTEYIQTKEEVADLKSELEGEQADMESLSQEMSTQQATLETTLTQMRAQIADFDSQLASAQAQAEAEVARLKEEQKVAQNDQKAQPSGDIEASAKPSAGNTGTVTTKPSAGNTGTVSNPPAGTAGAAVSTKPSAGNTENTGTASTKPSTGDVGSTGNTGTAAAKPSGGSTSGTTSKPEGSASGSSKPSNTATGQKIANKGCEYIGNPYVYGGNSLTEGIDCSGFVNQIHAKFGISTPRTSGALRTGGKAVAVSDMMPGDVICYSGHVAIYIGNGQIVHASNSKPYPAGGIKISSAYYKTILAVRRYW